MSTKEEIKGVLGGILSGLDIEIEQVNQQDLEKYWHFQWDSEVSLEKNIYRFYKMLELYQTFCRRWEENHHGHCCVVERVRDTYLMPKIRDFTKNIRESISSNIV